MKSVRDIQGIKADLHESIENINDAQVLLAIRELAERKYASNEDPILSARQLERIDEARKQISRGDFLTDEQADRIVEKWLNA